MKLIPSANLLAVGLSSALLLAAKPAAAQTNVYPPFQEMFNLVRSNLTDTGEAELNRAAVQGLLHELKSQVFLVTDLPAPATDDRSQLLTQTRCLEEAFVYWRVPHVGKGLAEQITSAFAPLNASNKLKGVVLDLRFASGTDYAAAAQAADCFIGTEMPLLTWGETTVKSSAKLDPISLPVVVLINHNTVGAAEALAAILRHTSVGLLIGSTTAGQATLFKEFTLSNGQHLRIATGAIRLGGDKPLPPQGLTPDIQVAVPPADERAFFADAYKVVVNPLAAVFREGLSSQTNASTATNRAARRLNEAELVRRQKEGENTDDEVVASGASAADTAVATIQDPALARALDLLKGLAVVQPRLKRP
jgi:hypothetical protein